MPPDAHVQPAGGRANSAPQHQVHAAGRLRQYWPVVECRIPWHHHPRLRSDVHRRWSADVGRVQLNDPWRMRSRVCQWNVPRGTDLPLPVARVCQSRCGGHVRALRAGGWWLHCAHATGSHERHFTAGGYCTEQAGHILAHSGRADAAIHGTIPECDVRCTEISCNSSNQKHTLQPVCR
eukprot:1180647-Prymnesium_polylepis.1